MFPNIHKNFSDLKHSQVGPLSLLCRVMTSMFSNREIITNRMYTMLSTCPAKNYDSDIETNCTGTAYIRHTWFYRLASSTQVKSQCSVFYPAASGGGCSWMSSVFYSHSLTYIFLLAGWEGEGYCRNRLQKGVFNELNHIRRKLNENFRKEIRNVFCNVRYMLKRASMSI
jgi:hypothetical protein